MDIRWKEQFRLHIMSTIQIKQVISFPVEGFDILLEESEAEGFRFLRRLKEDWENGANIFKEEGEGLYYLLEKGELVGIGGINIDPYISKTKAGRLRRFYIKKSKRGRQFGKKLLAFVLEKHRNDFAEFTLFTDTVAAARFYEMNGFSTVIGEAKVSHKKIQS